MTGTADVVVIGSGIGGLTAACLLARAGHRVRVFEQHVMAGGYATTFSRRHRRVTFDVSLHGIGGLGSDGLVRANFVRCGVWDRVRDRLIMPPAQYRACFPEHDMVVPQCDVPRYLARLGEDFPGERDGLYRLDAEIRVAYAQYERLQSRFFTDLFSNIRQYDRVVRYSRLTQQQLFDTFLRDDRCKAALACQWSYFGVPPSRLPAMSFIAFWEEYIRGGTYYLQGTGQTLVQAMVDEIRECGGTVETRTRVRRIIVTRTRATGVELGDGRRVSAGVVIANASPRTVVDQMLGAADLPSDYRCLVASLRPSLSSFQLFLELDRPAARLGHRDYMTILSPSYDADAQYAESAAAGIANAQVTLVAHGNIDPDSPAPGHLIATALSAHQPWATLGRAAYQQFKADTAAAIMARIEAVIPGVGRHVVVRDASTPCTNVRYTDNDSGAIYGFERDIAQAGRVRRMSSTPIDGLFFASAWTFPGGGYSGAMWAGHFCVYENGLLPIPDVQTRTPSDWNAVYTTPTLAPAIA